MNVVKKLDLEKEMYQEARLKGAGFEDLLEELDPSLDYEGTLQKAGAFARQLMAHGIKIHGPTADPIGKFFASTSSSVLFPPCTGSPPSHGRGRSAPPPRPRSYDPSCEPR